MISHVVSDAFIPVANARYRSFLTAELPAEPSSNPPKYAIFFFFKWDCL